MIIRKFQWSVIYLLIYLTINEMKQTNEMQVMKVNQFTTGLTYGTVLVAVLVSQNENDHVIVFHRNFEGEILNAVNSAEQNLNLSKRLWLKSELTKKKNGKNLVSLNLRGLHKPRHSFNKSSNFRRGS